MKSGKWTLSFVCVCVCVYMCVCVCVRILQSKEASKAPTAATSTGAAPDPPTRSSGAHEPPPRSLDLPTKRILGPRTGGGVGGPSGLGGGVSDGGQAGPGPSTVHPHKPTNKQTHKQTVSNGPPMMTVTKGPHVPEAPFDEEVCMCVYVCVRVSMCMCVLCVLPSGRVDLCQCVCVCVPAGSRDVARGGPGSGLASQAAAHTRGGAQTCRPPPHVRSARHDTNDKGMYSS